MEPKTDDVVKMIGIGIVEQNAERVVHRYTADYGPWVWATKNNWKRLSKKFQTQLLALKCFHDMKSDAEHFRQLEWDRMYLLCAAYGEEHKGQKQGEFLQRTVRYRECPIGAWFSEQCMSCEIPAQNHKLQQLPFHKPGKPADTTREHFDKIRRTADLNSFFRQRSEQQSYATPLGRRKNRKPEPIPVNAPPPPRPPSPEQHNVGFGVPSVSVTDIRTYLVVLGMNPADSPVFPTPEQVQKAFRKQAVKFHPDKNGGAAAVSQMKLLNAAKDLLGQEAQNDACRAIWSRLINK